MPTKTCAHCRHFTPEAPERFAGCVNGGTCAIGGPTPEEGCSDVRDDETCPKWTALRDAKRGIA